MAICVVLMGGSARAAPITFATAADYDNNAAQTSGVFRDFLNGALINRGSDLGGTGHSALNFTGSDNNAATAGRITLYDTNVTDGLPTVFSGNITMSADILISTFNNSKGAGLLFLFNEGTGLNGLALHLWNAGNSDSNRVQLVAQTGETRPLASLAQVALGNTIAQDVWYHLEMALTFAGTNFTVTGKVFGHTTPTDPNSALGAQIGTTLTYNSALSATLLSPYEIGLVARGDSAVVDTSVTNFSISGGGAAAAAVPLQPSTVAQLFAFGVLALMVWRRRRQSSVMCAAA
jgi:hypothetical protein